MRGAFVGRDAELTTLGGYLDDALGGRPAVVLCSGEPGIGKTRLAEELAALAADRRVPVVWGAGGASEGAPSYWPWRQALRGIDDAAAIAAGRGLTDDLARLAPE